MVGNRHQPRSLGRLPRKTDPALNRCQKGFLNDVLRFVVVLHDAACETEQPAIVLGNDGADRILVPAPGAGDEIGFRGEGAPGDFGVQ